MSEYRKGSCGLCRFFHQMRPGVIGGHCRRHPPTLVHLEWDNPDKGCGGFSEWPQVTVDDWCGEFVAKEAA